MVYSKQVFFIAVITGFFVVALSRPFDQDTNTDDEYSAIDGGGEGSVIDQVNNNDNTEDANLTETLYPENNGSPNEHSPAQQNESGSAGSFKITHIIRRQPLNSDGIGAAGADQVAITEVPHVTVPEVPSSSAVPFIVVDPASIEQENNGTDSDSSSASGAIIFESNESDSESESDSLPDPLDSQAITDDPEQGSEVFGSNSSSEDDDENEGNLDENYGTAKDSNQKENRQTNDTPEGEAQTIAASSPSLGSLWTTGLTSVLLVYLVI